MASPVGTPDVPHLPFDLDGAVKVFKLRAEPVRTEFIPDRAIDAWGFNGSVPGPTIEVTEGDRVRIIVENGLPEVFAPHWHGLEIPIEMDGVPGISQDPIQPGESHTYEFTLHQNGTFFYHSHMPMQEMMGMIGLFIIHPKQSHEPRVDRDFGIILQEWAVLPNNTVPNTMAMEFNWLTFNGKSGPATTPLVVKKGERVRIRLVNLGMDHHPIHLHGNQFYVTGTEGGRITGPYTTPQNTVLVGVAQARDIEFVAKYAGDWMFHCHLPHHMMNQMASMVAPPAATKGMTAGAMEPGMGIVKGGALAPENGPAMGRTLGGGSDPSRPAPDGVLAPQEHQHPASGDDPWKVRGYPQDMWMPMDGLAGDKPELLGLRENWTGAMMGMMTLVRVVEPELFDQIEQLQKAKRLGDAQ